MHMSKNTLLAMAFASSAAALFSIAHSIRGASSPDIALTGQVSSAEEGPMEGVLVSAKRAGSTVTTTVVTDDKGR
jgi:virginiamycin B lyase